VTNEVAYAVEGPTDEAVAEVLIRSVGLAPRRIFTARGKSRLDPKLSPVTLDEHGTDTL